MSFYTVQPMTDTRGRRCHAVIDPLGNVEVAYRAKKDAEASALGHTNFMFGDAEQDNERRDRALAYLAARAERVAAPRPQLELF